MNSRVSGSWRLRRLRFFLSVWSREVENGRTNGVKSAVEKGFDEFRTRGWGIRPSDHLRVNDLLYARSLTGQVTVRKKISDVDSQAACQIIQRV